MRKNFGAKEMCYPMPVFIIGTYNEDGTPNAMNAAWGGVTEEAELTICVEAGHKTAKNIQARKAFTVSMGTAEQVVARCISKGYGRARAKQALYEKRIPKEYWEEALKDYPEQTDKIMDFVESRLGDSPSDKDVKRAVDALLRRGHSYGAIRHAMREMAMDSDEIPEG